MKERLAALPGFGTLFRVLDRYRLDAAEQFAAAIGLFIFIALVPVFLLVIALLGFVFQDPADQLRVAEALASSIPGLGATLGGDAGVEGFVAGVVDNRGALTGYGIVGVFLTALRPVNAAMTATVTVFRAKVPEGMAARGRQLLAVVALGSIAFAAVGTSSVIGFVDLPGPTRWLVSVGATFALDVLLFWVAYTLLAPGSKVRGAALLPGALLAGTVWTGLKVAGSAYVSNQIESADALYGALGGVVALLLLLYLAGRFYLYGAELAAVRWEQANGPIPLPAGTTSLARMDDVLPDGSYVTAGGADPPWRAPGEDAPRTDPRKVVGYGVALLGVAAAYRILREIDS